MVDALSGLSATRIPCDFTTRTLYQLSAPVTRDDARGRAVTFDHLVLSLGRAGDTCVFPADDQGRILDMLGFGFGMGPGRWMVDCEFDDYVRECIDQHERDGGQSTSVYHAEAAS